MNPQWLIAMCPLAIPPLGAWFHMWQVQLENRCYIKHFED
jgi:hypothetical protein